RPPPTTEPGSTARPTLSLHDALPICRDGKWLASAHTDGNVHLWDATRLGEKQEPRRSLRVRVHGVAVQLAFSPDGRRLVGGGDRSEEHTSELQSRENLVCRLLLEKKE